MLCNWTGSCPVVTAAVIVATAMTATTVAVAMIAATAMVAVIVKIAMIETIAVIAKIATTVVVMNAKTGPNPHKANAHHARRKLQSLQRATPMS